MTTSIVTAPMQVKAERLAGMLPTFSRGRSKANGTGFYLIPGSKPTTAWYANHVGCNCPGFQQRGTCTHQLACLLEAQRAAAPCIEAPTGKSRRCDPCLAHVVDRLGI